MKHLFLALILGTLGMVNAQFTDQSGIANDSDNLILTGYTDVPMTHGNLTAIGYMKLTGIMTGYAGNEFKPDQDMNRAELMKTVVAGVYSWNEINGCDTAAHSFADVPKGEWYEKYLCVAKREGLVGGHPDGTFKGAESVTVAAAVKMISIADGYTQTEATPWYAPYGAYMARKNALPVYLPKLNENVPRAYVAEMIYRAQLHESKAASVENGQSEDVFFDSLTADEFTGDSRTPDLPPANEPVPHMDPSDPYFTEKIEDPLVADMLRALNAERARNDAGPLELSTPLSWAAQVHVDRIYTYDFFAHTTPGGSTVRDRVSASGFKAVFFGENLVRGVFDGDMGVDKWSHSPKHFANMKDPVHTHVGLGWAPDTKLGGYYWIAIFAQGFPQAGDDDPETRTNDTAGPAEGDDTVTYEELEH